MKAIETVYNGYRFRSRLEARWAVFFDAMGIKYIYEPEGFELELYDNDELITLRYLPDFYLPEYKLFAEVKGCDHRGEIDNEDVERMSWFIDYDGPCSNGIVMLGNIPSPRNVVSLFWAVWKWHGKGLKWMYILNDIPSEAGADITEGWYSSAPETFHDDLLLTHAADFNFDGTAHNSIRVKKALVAARSARFEFGE